jgi:hypothetical protein
VACARIASIISKVPLSRNTCADACCQAPVSDW